MSTSTALAAMDRRTRRIVEDMFAGHYLYEIQKKAMEALRAEGVDLTDDDIEAKAALPAGQFARECERVRRYYARTRPATHGRVMGATDPGLARTIAYATRNGCTYDEARAKLVAGR